MNRTGTRRAVPAIALTGPLPVVGAGAGRINEDWGAIHFAFTTNDGSGPYHTAGVLDGGTMAGTTHSLGRGFLAVWKAERVE